MAEEVKQDPKPATEPTEGAKTPEAAPEAPKPDEVKDAHGQPGVNKERHDKQVAEMQAKIDELTAKLDEAAKTATARDEFKAALEALKAESADKELTYALELAGVKNAKAAKALLADHGNDIAKLKAAEPWLFEGPKGTTGLKPAAVVVDDDEKLRREFGLPPKKG